MTKVFKKDHYHKVFGVEKEPDLTKEEKAANDYVNAVASIADHLWLMGRDLGPDGRRIPGSRIVKEYSLIERDLCWHPDIAKTSKFHDFVTEIKEEFKNL